MLTSTLCSLGLTYTSLQHFFDPRFKFQWVEPYVDLHQDEVQALLTNLHSVVRVFVATKLCTSATQ